MNSTPAQLRTRWHAQRDALLSDLRQLPSAFGLTAEGLHDCRNFLFNSGSWCGARAVLDGMAFEACDFSGGDFSHCSLMAPRFVTCKFDDCDFTEIAMWNCQFVDCRFDRCTFLGGQLGVEGLYRDCRFGACRFKSKGKSRNLFGHGALHDRCHFTGCTLDSLHLTSTRFVDCRFESRFRSVRFMGATATQWFTGHSAVAFEDCDLTPSTFKGCVIDDDCVLTRTHLPQPHGQCN